MNYSQTLKPIILNMMVTSFIFFKNAMNAVASTEISVFHQMDRLTLVALVLYKLP